MKLHESVKHCLLNEGENKAHQLLTDIEDAVDRISGLLDNSSSYRNARIEDLLRKANGILVDVAEELDSEM